jgi:hypothetical protein
MSQQYLKGVATMPPMERLVVGLCMGSMGQFLNFMVYKTLGAWAQWGAA